MKKAPKEQRSVQGKETQSTSLPQLLNDKEVMEILGVGRSKLHDLMHDEELPLPSVHFGTRLKFDKNDLTNWYEMWKEKCAAKRERRTNDEVRRIRPLRKTTRQG